MNSFFVFFQCFEVCFQASFLVAKRTLFLELCFALGVLFGAFRRLFFAHFGSCFFLGRTLGALGANLFITKTVWTTKGAPIGISPKIPSVFWSHFGLIFYDFFGFSSPVLKHSFCLSSGTDFSWILASLRHHFFTVVCSCRHL